MAYTDIDDPTIYFNTKLYTGNGTAIGSGGLAVTGVGFQPDWVWLKNRTTGDRSHQVYDVIRGVTKGLKTNSSDEENTSSERLTAFGSDGFTVGNNGDVNTSGNAHVSWNWKAGTSFSNDASATSVGSIDSSGSVSTDAGFSIISYTGSGSAATIGHGLGSTPQVIIIKNRSSSFSWEFGHSSIASNFSKKLKLDTTSAEITDTGAFNNTAPTSSVFTVGNNSSSNGSGNNMIAYCFADIKGYSKFGSYTGNGNADGTFVYTGFKPAFVLCKNTGNGGAQWLMVDNKRVGINPIQHYLQSNSSSAEGSDTANFDFLSNGFKCRSTNSWSNQSGYNIIYMAFAESPFVNSNGVPNNAR